LFSNITPKPIPVHEDVPCGLGHDAAASVLTMATKRKLCLVVGECGDGKSTLINALRDPDRSGEASAGLKSRGVTKEITAYVGMPIGRV